MYNEEYFNNHEDCDISVTADSYSVDSNVHHQRMLIKEMKLNDPGYYKFKQCVNGEKKTVEVYSTSMLRNALIRHAVSGSKYNHHSGSKYEDLYFSVMDVGLISNKSNKDDPRKLYYNSPEEFERHQNVTVSENLKEDWRIRNIKAINRFCR